MTESDADDDPTRRLTIDAVSASNSLYDGSPPTYGSREDRLRHVGEEYNTADEVDPRSLFEEPTVNYLRWLYRESGPAKTVVEKPVRDAFKHGFEVTSNEPNNSRKAAAWLHNVYVPTYRSARIKARRDGLALIFYMVEDTASVSEPVSNPTGLAGLKLWSLEDLADGAGNPRVRDRNTVNTLQSPQEAAEHTEYDEEQLVVTKSGLVVVDDISSTDDGAFVGVMYDRNPNLSDVDGYTFIHADRLQLLTCRPEVDGEVQYAEYGHVEGDSVLTPIVHALTGVTKAEWAMGQTLLRYTAPLHAIEIESDVQPTEDDWQTHIDKLNDDLDNITNKSNVTLPPGHSMDTHGMDGDIDPEPFLNVLYNSICSGSEITRSVLIGTQTGTVSGEASNIKNYFNQVQRRRNSTYEADMHEAARMAARFDNTMIPNFELSFNIEWGPLFKIDDLDRTDGMMKIVSAVGNAVSNYLVSKEDAQAILEQEWARIDVDVDLDELTEERMDELDRINTAKEKQYPKGTSAEEEVEGETERSGQNEGGREGGNTTDPNNPAN